MEWSSKRSRWELGGLYHINKFDSDIEIIR